MVLPTPQVPQKFLAVVNDAFVVGLNDALFAAGIIMLPGTILAYLILPQHNHAVGL